jgi:hypothetical protein
LEKADQIMWTETLSPICFATTIAGSPRVVFVDRIAALEDLETSEISDVEFMEWVTDNIEMLESEAQRFVTGLNEVTDDYMVGRIETIH